MNVYQDITLLPMADIDIHFLWEKVYHKIHLALVENKMSNGLSSIGLSFPKYDIEKHQLGNVLRVFSTEREMLEKFNAKKFLANLSDYVHLTGIREVPGNINHYVRFKRKQSKSNTERLARRKANRKGISVEEAMQILKNHEEVVLTDPFVNITSLSSENSFKLFICKELCTEFINKGFSCYGLSSESTLPHF